MIVQLTPGSGFTALHSFHGADGASPFAALLQARDGNFYGRTSRGGLGQVGGTGFQMTPSGSLTTLHAFDASRESPTPEAKLVEGNDGALWGTTFGQYIRGRVFRITTDGTLSNIHSFDDSEGGNPIASLLLASDGNLYGITGPGGSTIDKERAFEWLGKAYQPSSSLWPPCFRQRSSLGSKTSGRR